MTRPTVIGCGNFEREKRLSPRRNLGMSWPQLRSHEIADRMRPSPLSAPSPGARYYGARFPGSRWVMIESRQIFGPQRGRGWWGRASVELAGLFSGCLGSRSQYLRGRSINFVRRSEIISSRSGALSDAREIFEIHTSHLWIHLCTFMNIYLWTPR